MVAVDGRWHRDPLPPRLYELQQPGLSQHILEHDAIGPKLKVAVPRLQFAGGRIVQMPKHHLVDQCQRPAEPLAYHLQVLFHAHIQRRDALRRGLDRNHCPILPGLRCDQVGGSGRRVDNMEMAKSISIGYGRWNCATFATSSPSPRKATSPGPPNGSACSNRHSASRSRPWSANSRFSCSAASHVAWSLPTRAMRCWTMPVPFSPMSIMPSPPPAAPRAGSKGASPSARSE